MTFRKQFILLSVQFFELLIHWILFVKRYRLHVIDLDPSSVSSGGWLEDTSLVEKYSISEEAYSKRDGKVSMKANFVIVGKNFIFLSFYSC